MVCLLFSIRYFSFHSFICYFTIFYLVNFSYLFLFSFLWLCPLIDFFSSLFFFLVLVTITEVMDNPAVLYVLVCWSWRWYSWCYFVRCRLVRVPPSQIVVPLPRRQRTAFTARVDPMASWRCFFFSRLGKKAAYHCIKKKNKSFTTPQLHVDCNHYKKRMLARGQPKLLLPF